MAVFFISNFGYMLGIMKVHHIALAVSDTEMISSWYIKCFFFEIIHQYSKNERLFTMLEKDGVRIELVENTNLVKNASNNTSLDFFTTGQHHFCFEFSDIESERTRLQNLDVSIETDTRRAGFPARYFFIKDPENNLIEILATN